jgi:hypothetical protein
MERREAQHSRAFTVKDMRAEEREFRRIGRLVLL